MELFCFLSFSVNRGIYFIPVPLFIGQFIKRGFSIKKVFDSPEKLFYFFNFFVFLLSLYLFVLKLFFVWEDKRGLNFSVFHLFLARLQNAL